jgi:hypothetical protein
MESCKQRSRSRDCGRGKVCTPRPHPQARQRGETAPAPRRAMIAQCLFRYNSRFMRCPDARSKLRQPRSRLSAAASRRRGLTQLCRHNCQAGTRLSSPTTVVGPLPPGRALTCYAPSSSKNGFCRRSQYAQQPGLAWWRPRCIHPFNPWTIWRDLPAPCLERQDAPRSAARPVPPRTAPKGVSRSQAP